MIKKKQPTTRIKSPTQIKPLTQIKLFTLSWNEIVMIIILALVAINGLYNYWRMSN